MVSSTCHSTEDKTDSPSWTMLKLTSRLVCCQICGSAAFQLQCSSAVQVDSPSSENSGIQRRLILVMKAELLVRALLI